MKAINSIAFLLALFSCHAHAEIIESETNLYYLQGKQYLDPETAAVAKGAVIGIEHTTDYHWGKSFASTAKARHSLNVFF